MQVATIETSPRRLPGLGMPRFLKRLGGWYSRFRRQRQEERARFAIYFQTYGQLALTSDAELARCGKSRLDLADMALAAAYGDRR